MKSNVVSALAAALLLGCGTGEPPRVSVEIGPITFRPHLVEVTGYCARPQETDGDLAVFKAMTETERENGPWCIGSRNYNVCKGFWKGETLCARGNRDIRIGTIAIVSDPDTGEVIHRCRIVDTLNKRYDGTGNIDVLVGTYRESDCEQEARMRWGREKKRRVRYEDPVRLDGPSTLLARAE